MPDPIMPQGTRLFQINENDLAELERTLPRLLEACYATVDNRQRVQWRRVQQILTDVRWNYGPPSHVEMIPVDEEPRP